MWISIQKLRARKQKEFEMSGGQKKILIFVFFLALVGFIGYFERGALSFEEIQKNREAFRRFVEAHYLPSVTGFIGFELLTAFFLPGALVLTLLGGFLFGVVWGTVYVMVGMTFGGSLAFLFARFLAGNWIHARYEDHLKKFNKEVAHHGSSYLLMLIISPVLPFFVVNYLAGMTKMSLKRFFLTTAAGILPGCVIYAYAGQQFGNIHSIHDVMTPKLIIALSLLGILALLPVFLRLFGKRFSDEQRSNKRE